MAYRADDFRMPHEPSELNDLPLLAAVLRACADCSHPLSTPAEIVNGLPGILTTQLPFVVALFTAIKNDPQLRHLTCLVDSNGMLSETGWEKLLPVCDGAMLDLKAWGSECHQQLTGRDNQQIKRSICLLAERGKLAELRLLVIPGQVDYLQHIEELAVFIKGLGDVPVRLNAFHAHGVYGEAQSWASATPEDVEPLADALKVRGVSRLIFPALYL